MKSFPGFFFNVAVLAGLVLPTLSAPGAVDSNNVGTYATPQYISASSPLWPNQTAFASIGAIPIRPFANVCYFGSEFNQSACSVAQAGYTNGFFRSDQVGSGQTLNSESCGGDCWLNTFATNQPQIPGDQCRQGRIPLYSVEINSAVDAQRAIAFAIKNKVKITVKNTGHEYLLRAQSGGGSSALQLWTHKMKSRTFASSWRAEGCSGEAPVKAIILGSGVQARDAYQFATDNDVVITLGAYDSVGVAGGFAMGGGHGPLGPKFGLAVDNILQFRIVLASGAYEVVNKCSNPDLFRALRGGGGGSWGVVIEVVYLAHSATEIQFAGIDVGPSLLGSLNPDATMADYVQQVAKYTNFWAEGAWAGYLFLYPSNYSFSYSKPASGPAEKAIALSDMKPFFDYLSSSPLYTVTKKTQTTFPSLQIYVNEFMNPGRINTPVAFAEALAGRIIPRSLLATPAGQQAFADAVVKGKNINVRPLSLSAVTGLLQPIAVQLYTTGRSSKQPDSGALVNSAWKTGTMQIVYAQGWTKYFPQSQRDEFQKQAYDALGPLKALTPNGGCYYSEASILEENWQQTFFGSNYPELLKIKQKYDPANVFNVFKGVGWTGPTDPTYSCYRQA